MLIAIRTYTNKIKQIQDHMLTWETCNAYVASMHNKTLVIQDSVSQYTSIMYLVIIHSILTKSNKGFGFKYCSTTIDQARKNTFTIMAKSRHNIHA